MQIGAGTTLGYGAITISADKDVSPSVVVNYNGRRLDYIQAGTPVVCADFPEMRAVIEEYAVGEVFAAHDAESLAKLVRNMIDNNDKMLEYHSNCVSASKVLNWENEQKILLGIYEE